MQMGDNNFKTFVKLWEFQQSFWLENEVLKLKLKHSSDQNLRDVSQKIIELPMPEHDDMITWHLIRDWDNYLRDPGISHSILCALEKSGRFKLERPLSTHVRCFPPCNPRIQVELSNKTQKCCIGNDRFREEQDLLESTEILLPIMKNDTNPYYLELIPPFPVVLLNSQKKEYDIASRVRDPRRRTEILNEILKQEVLIKTRLRRREDIVRERAYEIWEKKGNHDSLANWFEAIAELNI